MDYRTYQAISSAYPAELVETLTHADLLAARARAVEDPLLARLCVAVVDLHTVAALLLLRPPGTLLDLDEAAANLGNDCAMYHRASLYVLASVVPDGPEGARELMAHAHDALRALNSQD